MGLSSIKWSIFEFRRMKIRNYLAKLKQERKSSSKKGKSQINKSKQLDAAAIFVILTVQLEKLMFIKNRYYTFCSVYI